MSDGYRLFWGDGHTNLHLHPAGSAPAADTPAGGEAHTNLPSEVFADLQASLAHARKVIDFWPIAYYPYAYELRGGFRVEDWRGDEEVDAWCREMLEKSPTALKVLKASFNADSDNIYGISEMAHHSLALYYETDEAMEGRNAFVEKRPPDFSKYR